MPAVNPVGHGLERNAAADTFTKAGTSVIRYFEPGHDGLVFGAPQHRDLRFKPGFCQYMEEFKFVYLFPK